MQWDALLKRNLKIRKLILYRIASDLPRLLSGESKILSFFLEYKQIFFGEGEEIVLPLLILSGKGNVSKFTILKYLLIQIFLN